MHPKTKIELYEVSKLTVGQGIYKWQSRIDVYNLGLNQCDIIIYGSHLSFKIIYYSNNSSIFYCTQGKQIRKIVQTLEILY